VNNLFDSSVALVLASATLVTLVFSVLFYVATTFAAVLTAASKVDLFESGLAAAESVFSSSFGSYAKECLW
jgi:hypothetical protein